MPNKNGELRKIRKKDCNNSKKEKLSKQKINKKYDF
jgi:hypothetical protein